MWKFSYIFSIMAIFYFINWIVAEETIEGGKLFKGGNYSRKYGMYKFSPTDQNWPLHHFNINFFQSLKKNIKRFQISHFQSQFSKSKIRWIYLKMKFNYSCFWTLNWWGQQCWNMFFKKVKSLCWLTSFYQFFIPILSINVSLVEQLLTGTFWLIRFLKQFIF